MKFKFFNVFFKIKILNIKKLISSIILIIIIIEVIMVVVIKKDKVATQH
jgi:hypothetical protein